MNGEPTQPSKDSIATRGSMIVRLGDPSDDITWDDFYRRYRPLVFGFALKLSLTPEEAEEVSQDVFTEVAQKIGDFDAQRGRGSFRSWLFQLTEWRVRDKLRARNRQLPAVQLPEGHSNVDGLVDQIPTSSDLETRWSIEWANHRMNLALDRLKSKVDEDKFQAFQLHVIQEWSVREVASSLGMNPATVCVNTHRMRRLLRQELARLID